MNSNEAPTDENRQVIAAGKEVVEAEWETSIHAYRNLLLVQGHMGLRAGQGVQGDRLDNFRANRQRS